jgi:translocation and assembly module TamB
MIADAVGSPIDLEGTAGFRASVSGDVDNPNAEVKLDMRSGRIDSLALDRLEVDAGYDGRRYVLRRLHLVGGNDSLDVDGWWSPGVSPTQIVRGPVDWNAAFDGPFEATLSGHGFSLAALGRALRRNVWLGGAFEGSVALSGSPRRPRAQFSLDIEPRAGLSFALPHTRFEGVYADGVLEIARMRMEGDVAAEVTGSFPLRVSLVDGVGLDRDAPVALSLDIRQPDGVARLGDYWHRLTVWEGGFRGDVDIGGTIDEPRFSGALSMDNADIQVAGMVERFEDVSARITLVDNVVQLTSLDARSDGGGSLNGSGSITLDGWSPASYRVDLFLRDLWLRSIPNVESQQRGQLTVSSHVWKDGRQIPSVTGSLEVKEAVLTGVLEDRGPNRASVTLPTDAPGWICSVDLDAENNVWIREPDLRMELGGQVIVKRDEAGLYLRGDLSVLRGQYTVYGNKFRIVDGALDFSTASLRPLIHINAYTPHRTEGGFERRIYLNLDWPRDKKEPEVSLSYDEPGYYESDIWRMLGGGVASGLAANTLERVVNEQMSGMTVEVEQRQAARRSQQGTPEQEMMIGVGKYLLEDLYLRYRRGLSLSRSQEVEVEYRLSNWFIIRSEMIRHAQRNYVGSNRQTLDEFNLDFRLRWEF